MRLHRFLVAEDIGDKKEITIDSKELVHQIRHVFRLRHGDEIIIFSGTGFDYHCKIDESNEKSKITGNNSIIQLLVTDKVRSRFVPKKKLFLAASLIKKDNFEWVVEKAVELGVTDIIPIRADRSEKKFLNNDRLEKIAIEATEQSGRGNVPKLHEIMDLVEVVKFLQKQEATMIAFHTDGGSFGDRKKDLKKKNEVEDKSGIESKPIAVFIGPEGGWSPNEIQMFHDEGVPIYCLGPQILRAETAIVSVLSLVVFDDF
ncbi:MAG: RsmE family RNA methyltransferase [Candidatus Paceibacterota bacterium]|jgi:16S rRNA (uracil1498-N3)-methyltransferase